jgi:hypothetical protein
MMKLEDLQNIGDIVTNPEQTLAKFVSETFSATGLVLGVTWEDFETTYPSKGAEAFPTCCDYKSILTAYINMLARQDLCKNGDFQIQLGALVCIKTTTTVDIQGHFFTNVVETIEYIGELTDEQKELLLHRSNYVWYN